MTDAPNYNDGKWHGWNGGECPVHPKTAVNVLYGDGGSQNGLAASMFCWEGPDEIPRSYIAAFCVVKEHRGPRECWVNFEIGEVSFADHVCGPKGKWVKVSEVIE